MASRVFRFFVLFLVVPLCHGLDVTILTPSKEGTEIALVLVPGAYISGEAYKTLAETIQEESPFRLWIGLTSDYKGQMANLIEVGPAIEMALDEMKTLGMNTDTVFLAGHSLGASVITYHGYLDPSGFAGLVLFGSVPGFPNDSMNTYPLPYTIINGDLDGISRISKLAEAYDRLLNSSDKDVKLTRAFTLLEGVNHGSSYASGPMPPNVVENDVEAEVTEEVAHQMIAEVANLFLVVTEGSETSLIDDSIEKLVSVVDDSTPKLQPLIEASYMEESGNVCPWALEAQGYIIGAPAALQSKLTLTNYVDNNETSFVQFKPTILNSTDDVVVVNTATRFIKPDRGLQARMSSKSVDCKMKRQEAVRMYLGEGDYKKEYSCKEINMAALDWALSKSSSLAKSRYESRGQTMVFGEDIMARRGSEWVETEMKYEKISTGEFQVTSIALLSGVDFYFTDQAGMHYCKLLSPYRAMEWIYLDCLRDGEPYVIDEPVTRPTSEGARNAKISFLSLAITLMTSLICSLSR